MQRPTGTGGRQMPPAAGTGGMTGGTMTTDASATTDTPPSADASLPGAADAAIDRPPSSSDVSSADVPPPPPADTAPPPPPGPAACPAMLNRGEFGVYPGGGIGNCSYATNMIPATIASVDSELYARSAACGACLEVSSQRGKIVATVIDQLPQPPGPRGHRFLLNRQALVQVAGAGVDSAMLDWRWVPCATNGPIVAHMKAGSNQFYWEVLFTNTTTPVAKLEFTADPNGAWMEVPRENYNYFRRTNARGLPERLRLTDGSGNIVTTGDLRWPLVITNPLPIGVQFPLACTP
ncbi:MAG TPA: expansin EXLX1 family cellulose-binding protein [Polyangia bacterium]